MYGADGYTRFSEPFRLYLPPECLKSLASSSTETSVPHLVDTGPPTLPVHSLYYHKTIMKMPQRVTTYIHYCVYVNGSKPWIAVLNLVSKCKNSLLVLINKSRWPLKLALNTGTFFTTYTQSVIQTPIYQYKPKIYPITACHVSPKRAMTPSTGLPITFKLQKINK